MKTLMTFMVLLGVFFTSIVSVFAENSYLYYYGQGCPHCANVDEYMKGTDGYERVNIEKKEVYFDKENSAAMSADAERLGVDGGGAVPFLIITDDAGEESYLIGDKPIIDHFTPILGEPKPNNNKTIALIILGVLAVAIPCIFIFGGKKD